MQHAANDDIAEKRSQRDSHLMFRLLEEKKRRGQAEKRVVKSVFKLSCRCRLGRGKRVFGI
jgi:hypothetical protein